MIAPFDPHPDELLYSVIARSAWRSHYPNAKTVMLRFFGTSTITASLPFGSHIEYLVTQLPKGASITSESLIWNHTLLPYFAPFLPIARTEQVIADMRGTGGACLHTRIGVMASTISGPNYLSYCPQCVVADRDRVGEAYWHREHHVPGVFICPHHQQWLFSSQALIENRKARHIYINAQEMLEAKTAQPSSSWSQPYHELLEYLAITSQWLLHYRNTPIGLDNLQQRYREALFHHDLATWHGRIHMKDLQSQFNKCFSPQLLHFLQCDLDSTSQDNWLARLVRKPTGTQHPLRHLLLWYLLKLTPAEVFAKNQHQTPFLSGPWPCLNPVCQHYRQISIDVCSITYPISMHGAPTGTFHCKICGFTYTRSGPDKHLQDCYRRGRIVHVGSVWESALKRMWSDCGFSVNAIACQLGVDPLTVKRHAKSLGLSFTRQLSHAALRVPERARNQKDNALTKEQTAHRIVWCALMQQYPDISRTKIRGCAPGLYTWLYRHDREWLQSNKPSKRRTVYPPRVNWQVRDANVAQEVSLAGNALRDTDAKPTQITITAIGRKIGQLALLQQHLYKMPQTTNALAQAVEDREAFAVRRIWWAVAKEANAHTQLHLWELIRAAGVERLVASLQVQDALEQAMAILAPW